jgi:biopolymer transport protein ExbD
MHRHRTALVHTSKKKPDEVRSDINVTPLVDVCLVLLIIFLVVAQELTRGKEVPLPKTQYHTQVRDTGEDLIISVSKSGGRTQLWWDRDGIKDIDELKKRLEEEFRRGKKPMFFKADADLKYGDVYPVLMAIKESGAMEIQLGTEELKEGSGK